MTVESWQHVTSFLIKATSSLIFFNGKGLIVDACWAGLPRFGFSEQVETGKRSEAGILPQLAVSTMKRYVSVTTHWLVPTTHWHAVLVLVPSGTWPVGASLSHYGGLVGGTCRSDSVLPFSFLSSTEAPFGCVSLGQITIRPAATWPNEQNGLRTNGVVQRFCLSLPGRSAGLIRQF